MADTPHADLIQLAEGLRGFYPPTGNAIGDLLDELIKDLKADAPREEIVGDATALRDTLDPNSSTYAVIGRILEAMGGA